MYVGIDLGTSAVKVVLLDETEKLRAEATASLTVSRPRAGWSEQDARQWIAATERALHTVAKAAPTCFAAIRAIGLSGQMHGATCVDTSGAPIRPAILWNDTRCAQEAAVLDAQPVFRKLSGNIVFPGFTAPKLAWMQKHEPKNAARIHKVLLPKDYLRYWLTGQYITDMSDAAGTGWLDIQKRDWSDELLHATNLQRENMPSLVEGSAPSTTLAANQAERFGLAKDVIIAGGAGDNAASAIGLGVVNEADAFVSLGTSGVLFVANENPRPNTDNAVHCFCHALPDTWHQMGVILACGDMLNWLASLTGRQTTDLLAALGDKPQTVSSSLCLPYLGGERTPHNNAAIRAGLIGISHQSDLNAITSAVLEGICFALRDCLIALEKSGTKITQLLAVGGGSLSDYWLSLLASVLNAPIVRVQGSELGASLGAARLAMLATGDSNDCPQPKATRVFEPDRLLIDALNENYTRFHNAYTTYKEI